MKQRYVIPAVIAMSMAAAGFAFAQGSAAVGNNSGAAGSNNTSPNTTGTGNAPAQPIGGAKAVGAPPTATPSTTGPAAAASSPSTSDNKGPSNNAVNTAPRNNPGAPQPGANSFTEGQARSRIQDHGFSQVTGLKLDNQGVWRGKAMRDGKSVDVAMDYQGNVVAK